MGVRNIPCRSLLPRSDSNDRPTSATWRRARSSANGKRREEVAPGLTAAERNQLTRLRRENKQLRLERDILSKAAAWFARETGTLPSGSSGS